MGVSDWKDLMPEEVDVYLFASRDAYGVPAYGTPATYDARVTYKPVRVVDAAGDEVVAKGVVWIATTDAITPEDAIELPDGTRPPILRVDRVSGESGAHHVKVYFG